MRSPRTFRPTAAVVLALASFALASCGDDEEEPAASTPPATTEAAPAEPASLAIKASGAKGKTTYTVPAEAPAGALEISLQNDSKEQTDAQLLRVEGEHTYKEALAELGKAMSSKPVADWFRAAAGPAGTEPGETSRVVQVLEPGTYYVVGGEKPPKEPVTFTVADGDGAPLPEAAASVVAKEYAFTATGLKAGKNTVEFRNEGKDWHHFLSAELKEGATIEDAKKFLTTEKGAPPFAGKEGDGIETTVMDGGTSQTVEVDLKAGRYAFFCFIADRAGGPPHVMKGMVSEVEVAP